MPGTEGPPSASLAGEAGAGSSANPEKRRLRAPSAGIPQGTRCLDQRKRGPCRRGGWHRLSLRTRSGARRLWNLVENQTVTGSDGAFLGWSVAFAPGALLVTSPFEKVSHGDASLERAGAPRIFQFGSTGIRRTPYELVAPNATECDVFGNALAVGRDFVAVGAPREDGNVPSGVPDEANESLDTAAVYVYPAKWSAHGEP